MKKIALLIMWILLLHSGIASNKEAQDKENKVGNKTFSILCTPDLFDLGQHLTLDYCKLNPGSIVNVIMAEHNELVDKLGNEASLGLVSELNYQSLENNSLWKIVVGRDVVVPIINSNNPYIDQIKQQGISSSELAEIIKNSQFMNWGSLFENGGNVPVNYYSITNASINSEIANFIETDKKYLNGIKVTNGKELVEAIQKDRFGIGFCKLTDITGSDNQGLADNINLLPIDKNSNGQMDYFEKIYDNLSDFTRGVWIGKYPKTLISNLYSVCKEIPQNEQELAFLKWILSEGQQSLVNNGYSMLIFSERQTKINSLNNQINYVDATENSYAIQKIGLLLLFVLLVTGITGYYTFKYRKSSKNTALKAISGNSKCINENSVEIQNGLYFDKTHTWVFMEKDGIVKIGIDDFLQHVTGMFTRIKMKNPGDSIKKNEPIFSLIQEGKQLNIYAPISGTIKDINEILVTHPSKINSSPYSDGWIYRIEPSNWLREIQFLKMAEQYREWLKNEFLRLKDFLASAVNAQSLSFAHVVYQEGGEITDNVLQNLGPEAWEDFQKKFIDTSVLH